MFFWSGSLWGGGVIMFDVCSVVWNGVGDEGDGVCVVLLLGFGIWSGVVGVCVICYVVLVVIGVVVW